MAIPKCFFDVCVEQVRYQFAWWFRLFGLDFFAGVIRTSCATSSASAVCSPFDDFSLLMMSGL